MPATSAAANGPPAPKAAAICPAPATILPTLPPAPSIDDDTSEIAAACLLRFSVVLPMRCRSVSVDAAVVVAALPCSLIAVVAFVASVANFCSLPTRDTAALSTLANSVLAWVASAVIVYLSCCSLIGASSQSQPCVRHDRRQ